MKVPQRPAVIHVPVSTDLLAELGEWSDPVQVRVEYSLVTSSFELTLRTYDPDVENAA